MHEQVQEFLFDVFLTNETNEQTNELSAWVSEC